MLLSAAVLNGCASYGVSAELRPYRHLAQMTEQRLNQEASTTLSKLEVDDAGLISPLTSCFVYRTAGGYFISGGANLRRGDAVQPKHPLYLGSDATQAAQSVVKMRAAIKQQRAVAQAEMILAIAAGLAASAQPPANYSIPETSYSTRSYAPTPKTAPVSMVPSSTPENYQGIDSHGTTTTVRPDYYGNYQATDSKGNSTTFYRDRWGNYQGTDSHGTTTTVRPNYYGNYQATDSKGNSTTFYRDRWGNYQGTDSHGTTTTFRPEQYGGSTVKR